MNVDNIEAKQHIALGRNKDKALRVIMPRVMGSLKHEGHVISEEGIQIFEVIKTISGSV